MRALGPEALDILDGIRPATYADRIDAALARVPLGVHTHFMNRARTGNARETLHVESRADRLALELLAPEREVWRSLHAMRSAASTAEDCKVVAHLLGVNFGLPMAVARAYARFLVEEWFDSSSAREWLGMSSKKIRVFVEKREFYPE